MNTGRRNFLQLSVAGGVFALGGGSLLGNAPEERTAGKRRVLAILGDAYHAVAPLDAALVGPLRKRGWLGVTIMDYRVPWGELPLYELIILSREGREYIDYYRQRDTHPQPDLLATGRDPQRRRWLTAEQGEQIVDYVQGGGRLFLYHDGVGDYPHNQGIAKVARANMNGHPPMVKIQLQPTGSLPELTKGVTPFELVDEEYNLEIDESQVAVFLESHSPENGRHVQGWAHTYGKGKVAVLIPGHSRESITHPMIQQCIRNCLEWLTA